MAIDAKTISIYMQVTGPFAAQMGANAAATQHFGNSAHAGFGKAQAGMSRWAKTAKTVGTVSAIAIAAGLALSAKAAIDFESSFAGVRKTVEATEPQFQRLAEGIRAMAREIPIGVNELNRIAELGGQLGVDQSNLVEFTEIIAKIGVTTTLSTEAAAVGFARIDNIMQTGQKTFGNMGAAIVELGNNFATTEDEILAFALRIAPIGKTVGLTTDEILSIATAFASVGIPAERGGTALQKVFLRISDAAIDGGARLETFAQVANMTSESFQDLAKHDPAAALEAFVVGLGDVIKSGQSTTPIFEALGLSNERVRNSLLAIANASDVLVEAFDTGEEAYEDVNALNEEAAKRFETTASKLLLLKNELVDVGITIGQDLLPIILTFVEGIKSIGSWVGNLHPIVQAGTAAFIAMHAAMQLMSAHPVIRVLTILAGAVFFIGSQAQNAKQRVEDLQAVLDKGFATNEDLKSIVGQDVIDMFISLGFSFE